MSFKCLGGFHAIILALRRPTCQYLVPRRARSSGNPNPERPLPAVDPPVVVADWAKPQHIEGIDIEKERQPGAAGTARHWNFKLKEMRRATARSARGCTLQALPMSVAAWQTLKRCLLFIVRYPLGFGELVRPLIVAKIRDRAIDCACERLPRRALGEATEVGW